MNKLNVLESMGFKISWKLISIGLFGLDEIPSLLISDDIFDYLQNSLTCVNDQTDDIILLICNKDNPSLWHNTLNQYACSDTSCAIIQKRKWRAYLLSNLIDNISENYFQGLLELMNFWVQMKKPADCPIYFPEKATTDKYFTPSTYHTFVKENRIWLRNEIKFIINSEI